MPRRTHAVDGGRSFEQIAVVPVVHGPEPRATRLLRLPQKTFI